MTIQRYRIIPEMTLQPDHPDHFHSWDAREDPNGEWVRYRDLLHYLVVESDLPEPAHGKVEIASRLRGIQLELIDLVTTLNRDGHVDMAQTMQSIVVELHSTIGHVEYRDGPPDNSQNAQEGLVSQQQIQQGAWNAMGPVK